MWIYRKIKHIYKTQPAQNLKQLSCAVELFCLINEPAVFFVSCLKLAIKLKYYKHKPINTRH